MFNFIPQVYAAGCDTSQGSLNLSDCLILNDKGETVASVYNSPAVLVKILMSNIFIVAGIILFFLIIYSGFLFLSGDKKGPDQAKTMMTTAVVGLLVMFAAYWILQIVKIVTGADLIYF
jgi:heme/copper-type cytochrome/quinol oxidase subunit 4